MKVIVIGDLIIDVYHQGKILGASVEALRFLPKTVIKHEISQVSAGGAGLLVRNMLTLGGNVVFLTCVGGDSYAKEEASLFHKRLKKIVLKDPKRKTTVKERFWAGDRKVLAWDRLDNRFVSSAIERKILNFAKNYIKNVDKVIISDYRHGLLTKTLAGRLVRLAKTNRKPIYVDSQVAQSKTNHAWYRGADLFCLNVKEAKSIDSKFTEREIKKSLVRIKKILQAKNVILKLGDKGSLSLLGEKFIKTKALKIKAVDTTGAGDAFFAVLALSKNLTERELKIANAWAGLKTTLCGTQTPSLIKLKKYIKSI